MKHKGNILNKQANNFLEEKVMRDRFLGYGQEARQKPQASSKKSFLNIRKQAIQSFSDRGKKIFLHLLSPSGNLLPTGTDRIAGKQC